MRALDARLAGRSAALLFAGGAVLLVVAAFLEDDSARPAILGLAGLAALVATALAILDRTGRAPVWLTFGGELLAVGIVAALVTQTGDSRSLVPAYYVLPVLHAAVFQNRIRTVIVGVAALVAFLAPLAYEPDRAGEFAPLAAAVLLPALAFAVVTHVVVRALRVERRALEEREAEALRIAESDELTGIGNYRRFWRALQSEAARARRHEQPFSLIVLDLDGFKAINDHLGHQAGDDTLRRVARALERAVREEDVLCRQGGDEFGVIAVAAGEAETSELARRLVHAVGEAGGHGLAEPLTASAGWATFGAPERSAEGLLALADRALRDAKRSGRSRIAPPGPAARPTAAAEPEPVWTGPPAATASPRRTAVPGPRRRCGPVRASAGPPTRGWPRWPSSRGRSRWPRTRSRSSSSPSRTSRKRWRRRPSSCGAARRAPDARASWRAGTTTRRPRPGRRSSRRASCSR